MENQLHVLVWLDPDVALGWSDEDVVRRWGRLLPPRDKSRRAIPVSNEWVDWRLKDAAWVAKIGERLQSLSRFMKCLKELERVVPTGGDALIHACSATRCYSCSSLRLAWSGPV